jgi:phosphoribosylformylglycinamidine synthase
MPKAEILDPQGKAIAGALERTGRGSFDVRAGKRFELTTPGPIDDAMLEAVRGIAHEVLSNSVIEDVIAVRVVDPVAERS